jgi:hypothetical protein
MVGKPGRSGGARVGAGLVATQVDDAHLRSPARQQVAIAAFKRRAGDHTGPADLPPGVDPRCDLLEPGPLVSVVERMAGVHLGDVRRRMEFVAFLEWPPESLGKGGSDRCLAATRDAYDNENCPNIGDLGFVCLQGRLCRCRTRDRRSR